jgi:hypothetical protein
VAQERTTLMITSEPAWDCEWQHARQKWASRMLMLECACTPNQDVGQRGKSECDQHRRLTCSLSISNRACASSNLPCSSFASARVRSQTARASCATSSCSRNCEIQRQSWINASIDDHGGRISTQRSAPHNYTQTRPPQLHTNTSGACRRICVNSS